MYLMELCGGFGISLCRCLLVPGVGEPSVLVDAAADVIEVAQLQLGLGQTLLGRRGAPVERLFLVWRRTLAFQQHDGEVVPRLAVALLGRAAVPFDSFLEVADDAGASAVHRRQLELRAGVALFGGVAEPQCGGGVSRRAAAIEMAPCEDALRFEV